MKKLSIILATFAAFFFAQGQIDRSQKPEPGPTKEIEIGEYEKFTLKNGLTVIVVENHKIPRVSFQLIVDRDPLVENEKVGYVALAGEILSRGTLSRTKEQLDEAVDFIGGTLSTSSTSIYASALTKHRETLLDLMTDVLYNPAFPEEELQKLKKQTLSNLKAGIDDPETISANVSAVLKYGKDHPYGEIQREEHIENITVEDLKKYYQTYFKPNISYLAIVGDITPKEAHTLAKKRFGKWKKGEVPEIEYEVPTPPDNNVVALVNRSASVQTVLNITYPIELQPGSPEFLKTSVLNQVFGGGSASRLFKNIREDKGYTYGAYSSISSDELVGTFNAGASVRNEVTDSALTEFLLEMEKMRDGSVDDKELQLAKNVLIGRFGRSLESPQTIAGYAVNIERYNLDPDYYNNYVNNIQAVTEKDIMAMAAQFIKPNQTYIVAVGKASEIEEGLKRFGDIQYFDIYGNELDPAFAKLPEGLTAEKVLNKYFEAIGGKEKLLQIETLKVVMSADARGSTLRMSQWRKDPDKIYMKIEAGGNVVNEQLYDGKEAKVISMGNPVPLTDEQKRQLKLESGTFPELFFNDRGVETTLLGIEEIDDQEVVSMEVANSPDQKYTLYFDTKTGLILRKTQTVETPDGQSLTLHTDFLDYKEYSGILVPSRIKIPLGPGMVVEAKMDEVVFDAEMEDSVFSLK